MLVAEVEGELVVALERVQFHGAIEEWRVSAGGHLSKSQTNDSSKLSQIVEDIALLFLYHPEHLAGHFDGSEMNRVPLCCPADLASAKLDVHRIWFI